MCQRGLLRQRVVPVTIGVFSSAPATPIGSKKSHAAGPALDIGGGDTCRPLADRELGDRRAVACLFRGERAITCKRKGDEQ